MNPTQTARELIELVKPDLESDIKNNETTGYGMYPALNPRSITTLMERLIRYEEALEKVVSGYAHSSSCNKSEFVKNNFLKCNCGAHVAHIKIAREALKGTNG